MVSLSIPGVNLTIHEITGGNVEHLDVLLELFIELFPQYAHTLPRVRHKAQRPTDANPLFIEHQWLVEVNGQAAAMSAFKYVPGRDLGLEIYLGVRPTYRRLGFGKYWRLSEFLISAALEQLMVDAQTVGRPNPMGLAFEVLSPKLMARYCEYGFVELPVEYNEPRYSPGRVTLIDPQRVDDVEFERVQLGIFPSNGSSVDIADASLLSDTTLAFLIDHYGLPQDHWIVSRALESIEAHCIEREKKR